MARPDVVSGLTAKGYNNSVLLEWDASDDTSITGYKFQVTPASDGSHKWDAHAIPNSGHGEKFSYWFVVSGLDNGTHYQFLVTAINDEGFSGSASPVSATPRAVPDQPTGLVAVPRDSGVLLEWDSPTDSSVDAHKVFISPPPFEDQGFEIMAVPHSGYGEANDSGYFINGLENDRYYVFTVYTVNHEGASFRADPVYAKPAENAADRDWGYPTVNFPNELPQDDDDDDDDEGEDSYFGFSSPSIFKIPGFPAIPFAPIFPAPFPGEGEDVNDWDGDGDDDDGGSGGSLSVPDRITGLQAWPTNNAVLLTWDDPEDDSITDYTYRIEYVTGGDWALVTIPNTGYNGYWVPDLGAEEEFIFSISAVNSAGTGWYSDPVSVTTPSDDIVDDGPGGPAPDPDDDGDDDDDVDEPTVVTGLEAHPTNGAVLLTWDAPTDPTVIAHKCRIDYVNGNDFAIVAIPDSGYGGLNQAGFWVQGLSSGENYMFSMAVVLPEGDSEYSAPVSVTTLNDGTPWDGEGPNI